MYYKAPFNRDGNPETQFAFLYVAAILSPIEYHYNLHMVNSLKMAQGMYITFASTMQIRQNPLWL